MKYIVQYRAASGELKEVETDAGSRNEALTVVRMRVEGQIVSVQKKDYTCHGGDFKWKVYVLVAVIGLIVSCGLFWILSHRVQPTPATVPQAEHNDHVHKLNRVSKKMVPSPFRSSISMANQTNHVEMPIRLEGGIEVVSSIVTTNKSGSVIERLVLADGTKKSKIHPPKPIFKHASDQVIALCLSVKEGQSMPPLPMLDTSLEQDFNEALSESIEIADDDTETVREIKARVIEARAYLVDEIKNGRTTLLEALREYQRRMEQTANVHTMALQEFNKISQEGTEEEARAFLEAVNTSFRARGIMEIKVGDTVPSEKRRRK